MPAKKQPTSPLHDLTEEQVSALDREATRGNALAYYESALISRAAFYHNKISGRVGNYLESNDVRVTFHDQEIAGTCTCQKSRKICKHIVVLMYAWINDAGEFLDVEKVLQEVAKMDKSRLLEIVENIIKQNPGFAEVFLSQDKPEWDEIDLEIN